jgi:HD-GYP domain-containing protein (c-di-GMP phosphodiesterase class II)
MKNYTLSDGDAENILQVIIAFNQKKNYHELLNIILDKMMFMANADAGTLYITDDTKLHFRILKNNTLKTYQSADDEISLPPVNLDENNITNVSAYSAVKNELVNVDDVYTDEKFNFTGPKEYDKLTGYRTESMLVYPLSTSGNEVIGVIQLINALDRKTGEVTSFKNTCDANLLLAIASIAANTLANVIYAKEIDELFHSFVSVMTKAIDERSVYSVNHTKNVARFCGDFADFLAEKYPAGHEFHFDTNRRDQLVMAAYLHDVGKIITPLSIMDKADRLGAKLETIRYKFEIKRQQVINDHMGEDREPCFELENLTNALKLIEEVNTAGFLTDELHERTKVLERITYRNHDDVVVPILSDEDKEALAIKRGTLTASEREIMQEHVSITKRLLEGMKFNKSYKDVARFAAGHHEHLDGKGYPYGLKGDELALEMCILSIADIFDALIAADRPYKRPMPTEKAHGVLRSMANDGKLHKDLLEKFIESKVWENEN